MTSPLYSAVEFMQSFGIFDVVLPFLLVFTVVYGILEKTKVFGTEKDKSRKNINAMVSFTIGFFVVAASQVVGILQTALPYVVLILIFLIAFMILFGSTLSESEKGLNVWSDLFGPKTKGVFAIGIFVAIVAIILGALNLLDNTIDYLFSTIGGPALSAVVLLLVVAFFMWYVMHSPDGEN
jgi:hypothetical protein